MLLVLRESAQPPSQRPTLAEADRLLESARASASERNYAQNDEPAVILSQAPSPRRRDGECREGRLMRVTRRKRIATPLPPAIRFFILA